MGVSSYRRVLVYDPQEKRHVMRDPWFLGRHDRVLTEEYSDSDEDEARLTAAEEILDALQTDASAYVLFILTFLKPKADREVSEGREDAVEIIGNALNSNAPAYWRFMQTFRDVDRSSSGE